MPFILNPNPRTVSGVSLGAANYSYRYPRGMDLKPGSKTHDRVLGNIMDMALKSHSAISAKYDTWNTIDKTLTAYIPLSEKEQALKSSDETKPVSTVVPVSYAVLETVLVYLVELFLATPMFHYEAVDDQDSLGAMLLELLVDMQCRKFKAGLAVHTMCRDALAYGFGAITPMWSQQRGFRTVAEPTILSSMGFGKPRRKREEVIQAEGNEFYNIDPYSCLPDPQYSIHDVQRSRYFGWVREESYLEILEREQNDPNVFNAKYVKHIGNRSTIGGDNSKRDKDGVRTDLSLGDEQCVTDVIYLYAKIVPKAWELGRSEYPEWWLFAVAGDSVILQAGPTDLDHNKVPVGVAAPEYDGYSTLPVSRLEIVSGQQTFVDFLFNSHMTNVRKAINDMFVVDPMLINLNDMLKPGAGKLIRLRKSAWGRGVVGAVEQLKVTDITQNHVSDALSTIALMEKFGGAPEMLQGIIRGGSERRSATEYKETKGSALSRLEKTARIMSLQAMYDLAYMVASQTQQFMSREQYVRIAGPNEYKLRELLGDAEGAMVSPMDILLDYDVRIHDGSLPSTGDPQQWAAMFQVLSANAPLAMNFDMMRIFQYWATLTGAKNVGSFLAKQQPVGANVMDNEQVLRQAEAGNIIPLEEAERELQA